VSRRGRIVASAHAYLIKTVPAASGVLDAPPPNVHRPGFQPAPIIDDVPILMASQ